MSTQINDGKQQMSTTPLTDTAKYTVRVSGRPMPDEVVQASFAGNLEIKLAAAQSELKLLGSACDKLRIAHKTEVKELYARAEVERLKGCCEELHTIIDATVTYRAPIYAKMKARAEKAEARLAFLIENGDDFIEEDRGLGPEWETSIERIDKMMKDKATA